MDLLKSGQKISIYIVKQDKLVEIIGSIAEIFDDRLSIDLPPYFMRYVEYLDVGKSLTVKVFSKYGTIDFNTIVISSPLEEGVFDIELDYNALKITLNNEIPLINSIEKLIIKDKDNVITTKTLAISTESVKFYCDKKIEIGQTFDCDLILPSDYGKISFKMTVSEQDIVYENEFIAKFYSMNEQDRETLLYYIYVYSNNDSEQDEE